MRSLLLVLICNSAIAAPIRHDDYIQLYGVYSYTHKDWPSDNWVEFNPNGTYSAKHYRTFYYGTWTRIGNSIRVEYVYTSIYINEDGTLSVSGWMGQGVSEIKILSPVTLSEDVCGLPLLWKLKYKHP